MRNMLTPAVPSAVQVFNMMLQILEDGRLTDSKVGPAASSSGCLSYFLKHGGRFCWLVPVPCVAEPQGASCCQCPFRNCCPGPNLAAFVTLLQGRTVDFKNTLLIMTSNVGSSVIEKGGGQLGFQLDIDQVLIREMFLRPSSSTAS